MSTPYLCGPQLFRGIKVGDQKKVKDACDFARFHLSEIQRRSGEDYAQHGCEVACTLRESSEDVSLVSVAILHDILVHPKGKQLLKQSPLTSDEQDLVRHMFSLRRLHIDASTKDLDKVIDAFTEDERLLVLRMAHRLNDVRHLDRFEPRLRRQIAHEALHMYSAIAGRLGMYAWRYEMEDICFRFLHPRIARNLEKRFELQKPLDEVSLQNTSRFLIKKLKEQGISSRMDQRIKYLYSTYRKMTMKNRKFEELTDRLALRVIVGDEMDCYRALGVIHASMHPIAGKLKDYIGAPKENGYQSIHTVVYPLPGVNEQPIEIQIRTEKMHQLCEYGAAAHGQYKYLTNVFQSRPARVDLFRNFESLREEVHSPGQFEKVLRKYFREDQIPLFDSESNLYHFKKPSSALDFVCLVYPKRVHRTKSIRINGRDRPLDTGLTAGDILEVKFGKEMTLRSEWMHACRHQGSLKLLKKYLNLS